MAYGKRDYESNSGSRSTVVGASKQSAVSIREAHGKSGSEDDNASGVGYDPPGDDCPDFDLGLTPFPSGFDPGEFRLNGSIGTCFKSPLGLGLHFV